MLRVNSHGAGPHGSIGSKEHIVWEQEHSNHEQIRDLLGAYALDALSAEERQRVRAHLAQCAECRAELARLQLAVHALPLSVTPRTPSPELRERIRAAVAAQPAASEQPAASRHQPPHPALERAEQPPAPSNVRVFPRWRAFAPWAAVAALFIVCLGLLGWNLQLRQHVSPALQVIALQPSNGAPVQGQVIYLPDQRVAVLRVEQLPPLAANQVYEIWLIKDNTPAPAGVFTQSQTAYAIPADLQNYQLLALTVEPGPSGSPQPTSKPFAVASLQRT